MRPRPHNAGTPNPTATSGRGARRLAALSKVGGNSGAGVPPRQAFGGQRKEKAR